jgi:hypothetical protein
MSLISHLKGLKIVIVRPNDVDDIIEIYAVEHDTKTLSAFYDDWDKALEKVKKNNPEEWSVDEVWKVLKNKGWRFMNPKTTTVTY